MKTKQLVISSVLSVAMLASGAVLAERPAQCGQQQTPGADGGTHQQGFMREGPAFSSARLALRLQLTVEQREQIKAIHDRARELTQPVVDQIILNRQTMKALVKADPYDAAQVQQLADTQGGLHSQLIVIRAGTKAAIYALLTADQRAILDKQGSDNAIVK